jgi:hypothetical protein
MFLATSSTIGLISGLIGEFSEEGLYSGPRYGLICGVIVGLIVGLNRGGSAVIKHYALRLSLWRNGYTPLNFIKFLDHCARLIFLKKVGGGYIFIHRMLLEYFADVRSPSKAWKEVIEPDEQALFENFAREIRDMQEAVAQQTGGPLRRGFHAKLHAGLIGEFQVLSGLPEYARFGVFAEARGLPSDHPLLQWLVRHSSGRAP